MKVYPPLHLTIRESQERFKNDENLESTIVSDEILFRYYEVFFENYRRTLENFFPTLAPYLATYQRYPYKTIIVRWGEGLLTFHQSFDKSIIEFKDIKDLGLTDYNLFEIKKIFDPCWMEFDFSKTRKYTETEAEIQGKALALDDVLQVFWLLIEKNEDFEKICLNLIEAETADYIESKKDKTDEIEIDLKLEIIIPEIAGFRRAENWGFIFKHYKEQRITADLLHQVETHLETVDSSLDIVCLITSGDITSIGKAIAVNNPRIRVWDRYVLNQLINKHLSVIGKYFESYNIAVESIAPEIERLRCSRYKEFENKLKSCPPGNKSFNQYELISKEILEYLFEGKLKPFDNQNETLDGTQRRDIIFRSLRNSSFFERIFAKFNADFIVFDAKNYKNEIEKQECEAISKYPNKAIGNFVVLISRKGEDERFKYTQSRIFRDENKVVLSINDADLLEMVFRKERGENPEDLLEDLLDQFLLNY